MASKIQKTKKTTRIIGRDNSGEIMEIIEFTRKLSCCKRFYKGNMKYQGYTVTVEHI